MRNLPLKTYEVKPNELRKEEVHLWRVNLNPLRPPLQYFRTLLSQDELQRAERFVQDHDRNHFLMGRGSLRIILSGYTQISPEKTAFEYGPNNKPALAKGQSNTHVSFNLSHSHDLALIAIAHTPRKIGVDLELIRTLKQTQGIIARHFSVNEQNEYNALPISQQKSAFFNLWSRKEAFFKAWGASILSSRMNELEVAFAPGHPAQIRAVPSSFYAAKNWLMQDLPIGTDYACCLVAELLFPEEELSLQHYSFDSPQEQKE